MSDDRGTVAASDMTYDAVQQLRAEMREVASELRSYSDRSSGERAALSERLARLEVEMKAMNDSQKRLEAETEKTEKETHANAIELHSMRRTVKVAGGVGAGIGASTFGLAELLLKVLM